MKRLLFIIIIFLTMKTSAQVAFKIIVTQGPVVAGDPFQVQYVMEDVDKDAEFFSPDFRNLHFISGPNVYAGSAYSADGPRKLKNIVFTLSSDKPGKFIIPGASARVNGLMIKSDNAVLEVISKEEAINRGILAQQQEAAGDDFLRPGEDPQEKVRRNLFMKVMVDKRSCFVGEPVTAVFKLYSRLHSKSDIVKNPGFYGFTVQDMIGLDEKLTTQETINGKTFDVHTVRKVQLYPLQAGAYTIDPMEVENKVEFSRSAVNKKTEQEIVEGVMSDPAKSEFKDPNSTVVENSMSTEPVLIMVKPVPERSKPADFNGATGRFVISASLSRAELARNEEGELTLVIHGQGNFTQLAAPVINWPAGIDGFEPEVKDSIDHSQSPLHGNRVFRFRFVSAKPGDYEIPALQFSFFDPDSNKYKTVTTAALRVRIKSEEKKSIHVTEERSSSNDGNPVTWLVASAIVLSLIAGFLLVRKRYSRKMTAPVELVMPIDTGIGKFLEPAALLVTGSRKEFCNALRKGVWDFLGSKLGLRGSVANKYQLRQSLQSRNIAPDIQRELFAVLDECEAGVFTSAEISLDKEKLLERTQVLIAALNDVL